MPLVVPINIDLMFFEYGVFFYSYGCMHFERAPRPKSGPHSSGLLAYRAYNPRACNLYKLLRLGFHLPGARLEGQHFNATFNISAVSIRHIDTHAVSIHTSCIIHTTCSR
jgi:hypothetical protein